MEKSINPDFSGNLIIWDIPCTFSFSKGYSLLIKPFESETDTFIQKCKELNGNFNGLDWIHGKSVFEYDYAFHPADEQGHGSYYRGTLTLIIDIVLQAFNPKGHEGNYLYDYIDLQGFRAIDFSGRAVDAVFPPKAVVEKTYGKDRKIEWKHYNDYAKEFDTEIKGKPCKLFFTTAIDRDYIDKDTNSLGTIYSIVRLEFDDRQDISMIEPCWQAVCTFLAFCTGQFNVTNLSIGLWDAKKGPGKLDLFGNIDCIINCDEVEDIRSIYPSYYRLPISILGEKVGTLFHLLSDKEAKPVLGFLRKTNTDITIDRNKIRDLCTAFEREFDLRSEELSDSNVVALVSNLQDTVKQFRQDHPTAIDDDEYNYISSSISVISRPARKKIICIHNRYKHTVDKHILDYRLFSPDTPPNTSDEQTEKDIGWLVKTRNSITHSAGIVDNEIPNLIFSRLKVSLLCSVLERASYSREEIKEIMNSYFKGTVY